MDTARLQDLSERCEALKYMYNRLTSLNGCRIALLFGSGDSIDCTLYSATTKDLRDDLQHLVEAQVRVYEDRIKKIVNPVPESSLEASPSGASAEK